jgi:hypothetical protein
MNINVFGDFNATTSTDNDFVELDDNVSENDDYCYDKYAHKLQNVNLPRKRSSQDEPKNNFGNYLIDFYKGNNLCICNGRFGDTPSLFTCKEASNVVYVIVSANFVKHVFDFSVLKICSMLSDAHCSLLVFN